MRFKSDRASSLLFPHSFSVTSFIPRQVHHTILRLVQLSSPFVNNERSCNLPAAISLYMNLPYCSDFAKKKTIKNNNTSKHHGPHRSQPSTQPKTTPIHSCEILSGFDNSLLYAIGTFHLWAAAEQYYYE